MAPNQAASCLRCHAHLGIAPDLRGQSLPRATACLLAGLALFALALHMPFLDMRSIGRVYTAGLFTGPANLELLGTHLVAVLVVITLVILPAAELLLLLCVLLGVQLPQAWAARLPPAWQRQLPRVLTLVFGYALRLRPYAMTEVFLIGSFVAYTRLQVIATVEIGPALLALGAMMLCLMAGLAELDTQTVWQRLHAASPAPEAAPVLPGHRLIGCDCCRLVLPAQEGDACPRCFAALHARKPAALPRTTALLLAGAIFYLPANIFPVMTVIRFGQGAPSTIIGGVGELIAYQMVPLAILVFVASIAVPLLKIIGLGSMLVMTQLGSARGLILRSRLYRIIDGVGRWSMIDIFMLTVLVALVRMGFIATVLPGLGSGAFAAVVLLTMFAAESFDPRLMWDRAAAALAQAALAQAAGAQAAGLGATGLPAADARASGPDTAPAAGLR